MRTGAQGMREVMLDDSIRSPATVDGPPLALRSLVVAAGYALGSWAGLAFNVPGSPFSVIWPPSAVLLVALLACPTAQWPLLLLAGIPAHLLTHPAVPLLLQASQYGHNCLLAVLAAGALRRLGGAPMRLDTLRRMGAFVAVAVLGAPAVAAFLAAWGHSAGHVASFELVWWRDFLSNALAFATIAPPALALLSGARPWRAPPRRWAEAAVLAAGIVAAGRAGAQAVFEGATVRADRASVPLPFLLWAAVRFGPAGAGVSLLLLAIALLGAEVRAGSDPGQLLVSIQTFLLAVSIPVLLLAALIQERNAAAGELRAAEARASMALEASRTGTWEWSPRSGEILWSPTSYRIFGVPRGTPLVLDSVREMVHPDDRAVVDAEVERAHREGVLELEVRVVRPDGSVRWMQVRGRAEPGLAAGRLAGVAVDVTQWKEVELALRESEARNRAILAAVPDLMFLQDREGRYLDYHALDPADLLVPPERFLGRTMFEVLPAELAERFMRSIEETLRDGGPSVVEYALRLGGATRSYESRLVRCGSDEVLSIVREVTAWRHSQAALAEREEALRTLTARLLEAQEEERSRVAREIHDDAGQQLAALAFEVSALNRRLTRSHPGEGESLAGLQRSIDTLAATIRGISHRLHPAVLEFAGLAAALRSHCAEAGAAAGVHVHLDIGAGVEAVPRDTALAIYRVVQEALRNVTRHAHAANAWVSVGRVGGELRVQVRDDGRGMRRSARAGLGLGMVSMRERVRLAGGTLEVISHRGRGTEVVARIPLPDAPQTGDPARSS